MEEARAKLREDQERAKLEEERRQHQREMDAERAKLRCV
jgi:hypothetical protein